MIGKNVSLPKHEATSSLIEVKSLAWQITSPLNNKLGFFKIKLKRLLYKTTYLIVECGSYLARQ